LPFDPTIPFDLTTDDPAFTHTFFFCHTSRNFFRTNVYSEKSSSPHRKASSPLPFDPIIPFDPTTNDPAFTHTLFFCHSSRNFFYTLTSNLIAASTGYASLAF
jgi:hypothetical protein